MFESVLYIVSGVACYGGAHQLHLATRNHGRHPHVVHAAMFFILAGFALCSAAAASAHSVAQLSFYGKLSVSLGILLCALLPWFVVLFTRYKNRVLPALLSSAWSVLLLLNLGSTSSLLYQDINLINQALPSGQVFHSLQTSPNPWWQLVEVTILSTLIFSFYVTYQYYRQVRKQLALALGSGLLVLLCTTFADLMINAGLIQSAYLAPMGFLLFLLIANVITKKPVAREERPGARPKPSNYQLTVNLNPSPAMHHRPADWSTAKKEGVHVAAPPAHAGITHQQSVPGFPFLENETIKPAPQSATQMPDPQPENVENVAVPEPAELSRIIEHAPAQPLRIDNPTVDQISDSLVDIAVQATLIMNRLQAGSADPEELESLSRKVRTRAIETRRITHRMLRTENEDSE